MKLELNTSIPIKFDLLDTVEDTRFVRGKIWVCHVGQNLNNSVFSKDVITKAIPSLSNIPVLGFIRVNENNEKDFAGHEQRIVIDEDGAKIEYMGRMYGIVPEVSHNAKFEMKIGDDGIEREYLTVEVILHTKFPECIEILSKEGIHSHSMELHPPSIKGQFNSRKLFEFSDFMFEGLCLLGEDVKPGITGSTIELFSQFNYSEQLSGMLKEFNNNFTEITKIKEGGKSVDKKLELFEKYPTLSEEDVAEIKANLESYTLEETEEKLKAVFEAKEEDQKEKSEPVVEVPDEKPTPSPESIVQPQPEDEDKAIPEQVSKDYSEQIKSTFNKEESKLSYLDHDQNKVYVTDTEDEKLYSLEYSVDEENVTLNLETKKAVRFAFVDLQEGEQFQALVTMEFAKQMAEDSTKDMTNKYEEYTVKYKEIESELNTANIEIGKLTKNFNEMNEKFNEVNSAYEARLDEELKAKVAEVFNQFSKELTDEEMSPIKEKANTSTIEEIENSLYALVGKKKAKFSATNNVPKVIVGLGNEDKKTTGKSYDALFERHLKNNF